MRQIKEVLRLKFEAKLSHEHIAAATGLSKGAVTSYLKRALDAGISWPLEPHLDDVVLEARLFRLASVPAAGHAASEFAHNRPYNAHIMLLAGLVQLNAGPNTA